MHLDMSYTGKTCLPYDHLPWKETLSLQKACAAVPTRKASNCDCSRAEYSVQIQDFWCYYSSGYNQILVGAFWQW